jgi:hypothetical protein
MKIAQGKRGTSAALGNAPKNERLPFSFSSAPARCRRGRKGKREIGGWGPVYPGRRPRDLCRELVCACPFRAAGRTLGRQL